MDNLITCPQIVFKNIIDCAIGSRGEYGGCSDIAILHDAQ